MTVKDAIGPFAFSLWQYLGYGIFLFAGWFVLFALCRAARDVRQHRRHLRELKSPQCRVVTLVRNVDRGEETSLVFSGVVGKRKPVRKAVPHA